MAYFGDYAKNQVVYVIQELAKEEKENGKSLSEVVESILEATNYGIASVIRMEE